MIVVDILLIILGVTVFTVRIIGRVVGITGIVIVDETSASTAVTVIIFIAVVAKGDSTVSFRFCTPDAVKAAVAECGEFFETVVTHDAVIEFMQGVFGKFCSAVETGELVRHGFVLLRCSLFWLIPQE